MENINIRIRQNDPNSKVEENGDAANKQDLNGRSWPPEQKAVEDTWMDMDLIG